MAKMRMGHDPRLKNKHTGSSFDSFLKEEKITLGDSLLQGLKEANEATQIRSLESEQRMQEILERLNQAEKQQKVEPQIEYRHTTIAKPDHRARKYAKALSKDLEHKIDEKLHQHHARLDHQTEKHMELSRAIKSLTSEQEELKDRQLALEQRKAEEKHIVTEKTVVKEKVSKFLLAACVVSLILNLVILFKK